MSDPALGSDVLVMINTGTVAIPVWTAIGAQRGLDVTEGNEAVDCSSKDSGNRRVLPGRYSSSVNFDALYLYDDTGFVKLLAAVRAREKVQLMQRRSSTNIEYAYAVCTSVQRSYPDQDDRTVSASFEVDGAWTPA